MNRIAIVAGLIALSACSSKEKKDSISYPTDMNKKGDVVDTYFGTDVPDPYRWLEDDNSEETKAWVDAQNEVTHNYLNQIPFRDKIKDRLTELWDYPTASAPSFSNGWWLEYRNDGTQNQSVLYGRKSLDEEASVLLDPNKLSDDGTVALSSLAIDKSGKYLAYAISRSGSDWQEIYLMDINTKEVLADHIDWVKFSGIAWYKDGFYYSRYPQPKDGDRLKAENKNCQVYYHKADTKQADDVLIYEDKQHENWGFSVSVSKDESLAMLYTTESTSGNRLAVFEPKVGMVNPTELVSNFDNDWSVIGKDDKQLFIKTNKDAPKYQLLSLATNKLNLEHAKSLIPEVKETLTSVRYTGGKLFANYLKDAKSQIKVYHTDGSFERDVQTGVGTVSGFGGDDAEITFYTLTSFTTPTDIYKYDIASGESTLYKQSAINFDGSLYETKQIFYTSTDGTQVPMFITYKKGIELDGTNPCLLYGYGGFNISITPSFSVTRLPWLENGGVLAVANIRGGGEYGEAWHKAGTKMHKQNVFNDFISAAEYLQKEKYTSPQKTVIQGGSNGGLLVGACLTQRPDLFAVALPAVGVLDMLRYQHFTIGRYWATDYGTSEDSPEMFNYLKSYSPLHNVTAGTKYPATLVTTADHDDRVVPAHSFKFAATLQEKASNESPQFIMISKNAGHGAGKPKSKVIEEYANIWAFTLFNMDEEF